MAKKTYIGDADSLAALVKKMYLGVGTESGGIINVGVARKVKKLYIGDPNGVAKLVFQSEKDPGSVSISPTSIILNGSTLSKIITVSRLGSGAITAKSSNTSVATVSVSSTRVTVKSVDYTSGTATITITVAEDDDYKQVSVTCPITADFSIEYYGTTSEDIGYRHYTAAASIGDYALFGGGSTGDAIRDDVYAYNSSLTRSTATEMGQPKYQHAASSNGVYALFGGGSYDFGVSRMSSTVYAYDKSLTMTSPSSNLTGSRYDSLAAAAFGDYVLFGGGSKFSSSSTGYRSNIDIYDKTLTKRGASLSVARDNLAAASNSSYVLFGGGDNGNLVDTVEAYDTSLTRTIPTALSSSRYGLSAARAGDYIIFYGGGDYVDMYNKSLTRTFISQKAYYGSAGVTYNNHAVFAGGTTLSSKPTSYSSVISFDSSLTMMMLANLASSAGYLGAAIAGEFLLFGGGGKGSTASGANSGTVSVYIMS